MPSSAPLTAQFAPLVHAVVTKGTAMLDAPGINAGQMALLCGQLAELVKALRPAEFTALDISGLVNSSGTQFVLSALTSRPVLLAVNGLVLRRSKWSWDAPNQALSLVGYHFPAGATVEVYTLWHGDEELLPPPPSA